MPLTRVCEMADVARVRQTILASSICYGCTLADEVSTAGSAMLAL